MRTVYSQMAKCGSGKKHLRTLVEKRRELANRNAAKDGFSEKFHNPRSERINESMSPSPWGQRLQSWRKGLSLIAKEAAAKLAIPFDTYRGWESGKHTPTRLAQTEVERRMKSAMM